MHLNVYTIRDSKGGMYDIPFYARSHGSAERSFQELASDQKSPVSKYPEDYDLYHLGKFDDQTGKIETLETPNHMLKATQFSIKKDA